MKEKSYFVHDRTDIFKLVPKDIKTVLDVGCGEGILGKRFKDLGITVTGIEKDQRSSKEAEKYLDRVICCDIERNEPGLEEKSFDCMIFGDILEHVYDPQKFLREYKRYLKDNGIVIASIPNIRYYKVIIRLLFGSWDYVDSGILDASHVRFFTLINIKEMFSEAGFKIISVGRNIVASRGFRLFNFIFLNLLREFLVYQYYIVAEKSAGNSQPVKKRRIYKF